MIGPETPAGSGLTSKEEPEGPADAVPPPVSPDVQREMAVRWGIGCLVGAVALIGVLLLSALVSFYLQPPAWVQILLGVVLALGAVVLAWLVATAWGRSSLREGTPDERRRSR